MPQGGVGVVVIAAAVVVEITAIDGVAVVAAGITAVVVAAVEKAVRAETLVIVGGIKKNDTAFQHRTCGN
jgi:ethanolamine ammonia-lyase large subunit